MENDNKPINFHWMWRRHWQVDDSTEHLSLKGIFQMGQELDDANVKSVLLPYGPGGIDFSLVISEVLQSTKQMIMTIALPAYGVSPDYAAKIVDTLNIYGPNRIGVNLVAGRWGDEGGGFAEQLVLDHYMHDSSLIDTLEKRVAISSVWMDNFVKLIDRHRYKTHLAVVGSSDTTIEIANKHTEYIYVDENFLKSEQFKKITNSKPILIIDPLIIDNPEDEKNIKYDVNAAPRHQHHHVKGTIEEVTEYIKDLSRQFNIYDFMIHTDQADISKLLKLVKEFDKVELKNNNDLEHFDMVQVSENKDAESLNLIKLNNQIFERLGNGQENIKILPNFLSPEECKDIVESIRNTPTSSSKPVQFSPQGEPVCFRNDWDRSAYIDKYKSMVFDLIQEHFHVKLKHRSAKIAEWTKNDRFQLHIDDLGTNEYHGASATIYLNDDYVGGEIYFPLHNMSIKPKVGDLILFPANKNYEHIINVIESGSRYTIPLWYTFLEDGN